MGGRAEAGESVGGEEAGVWGQALHKPGEGRGAREGERAPRPCAIRPQPRGPGSVTETQLPRTCISALTQPGHRKSSLTPTTPLGPRSALLLTLLILSPNISGSGCSLPPSPPTHTLRGNLLAAQLYSPAGCACGPSDHPLVLRTWPGGAFHRPACGDQEGGVSTKRQSSEPSWDVNHRGAGPDGLRKETTGASLGVQRLRRHTPNARGLGLIPGQGSRSHTPQQTPGTAK